MGSEQTLLQHKNYLLFSTTLEDKNDYTQLIQAMKDYSKRSYLSEQITENDIPFSIVFILNLLTRFPLPLVADDHQNGGKSSAFKRYLVKYIEYYFLDNYKPDEIPLLYSIICDYISNGLSTLSFDHKQHYKTIKSESIKYHELAVEYLMKHSHNKSSNLSSDLSESFTQLLQKTHSTMLHMHLLNELTTCSNDNASNLKKRNYCKNSIFLMDESFKRFIVDHRNYSIYDRDSDDCCKAGFVFVCEMAKRMIQHDAPKKNEKSAYQKRYKYLLKIALKSWAKYIGTGGERYGLYHIYLGYYYAIFCKKKNKLEKSLKLLYTGINIIHKYNKYTHTLLDVYIFVVWIEKALCNFDECINVIKMSMDFNRYYKLTVELNEDKEDLKQLKRMQKWNKWKRKAYGKQYWECHLQQRKYTTSINPIYSQSLSSWTYYFKQDEWYRVMKNICMMKECNYSKCRTKSVKLRKCSTCKSVFYCCRNHQKIDWKTKHGIQCQLSVERNPFITLQNSIKRWKELMQNDKYVRLVDIFS